VVHEEIATNTRREWVSWTVENAKLRTKTQTKSEVYDTRIVRQDSDWIGVYRQRGTKWPQG